MRHIVIALLPGLAGFCGAALAQPAATPQATLAAWVAAYDSNDGPRAGAVYTEDARLWGSLSREQSVGRDAISRYFGRARPNATAISVRLGPHALRDLTPDVAVVSGHYTFTRRQADGTEGQEPSRFSMTLLRGADGLWRIADHHSSRLPPAP